MRIKIDADLQMNRINRLPVMSCFKMNAKILFGFTVLFIFVLSLAPFSGISANILQHASDIEKDLLLQWVNDHCDEDHKSFESLVKDRRIKCKYKSGENVPPSYDYLDGGRYIPAPSKNPIRDYIFGTSFLYVLPLPCIIFFYFAVIGLHFARKLKTNLYTFSFKMLWLVLPLTVIFYSVTIYQNQFLKGNVKFIQMHGNGSINSILLKICSKNVIYANKSWVYTAVETGSLDMVRFIVEDMNVHPNWKYEHLDLLPLALAANHQMTDIMNYLMAYAPHDPDEGGVNLLKTAVLTGRLDYVKKVLEYDRAKNQINLQTWGAPWIAQKSTLYLAVYRNYIDIAAFLLENGADPNYSNRCDGKTPLDAAKLNENIEMQKLLKTYIDYT